jgi:hypothetical protein
VSLEKEVEQNTALLKEEETSYHYLNGLATVTAARQHMRTSSLCASMMGCDMIHFICVDGCGVMGHVWVQ